MKKLLAGIGAALLLAAVVAAGALTSLGSAGTPAIRSTPPLAAASQHEDRTHGRNEHARGRGHEREHHHRGRTHGEDD